MIEKKVIYKFSNMRKMDQKILNPKYRSPSSKKKKKMPDLIPQSLKLIPQIQTHPNLNTKAKTPNPQTWNPKT